MKTAEDVITDFKELTLDQQEKVVEFVISVQKQGDTRFLNKAFLEEYIEEENYSPGDIARLNRAQEEANLGINTNGPFKGKEAIGFLQKLRNA